MAGGMRIKNLINRFEDFQKGIKLNKWYRYFTRCIRILLAAGFIPSGLTKILDERFTSLSSKHPMGNYLEALYNTGFYYHFIGYAQVLAAILLLIPRTATLGALIYFPIILNICILSLAVGFDGSLVTSPLMVWATIYLICWDYDKLKFIFRTENKMDAIVLHNHTKYHDKFPFKFFVVVIFLIASTIIVVTNGYDKKTRNTYQDCIDDCVENSQECYEFCDCIHNQGNSFNTCSEEMRKPEL